MARQPLETSEGQIHQRSRFLQNCKDAACVLKEGSVILVGLRLEDLTLPLLGGDSTRRYATYGSAGAGDFARSNANDIMCNCSIALPGDPADLSLPTGLGSVGHSIAALFLIDPGGEKALPSVLTSQSTQGWTSYAEKFMQMRAGRPHSSRDAYHRLKAPLL